MGLAADLIVRSTRVVTPTRIEPGAVHIAQGRILRVSSHDDYPRNVALDDTGDLIVMPGLVDSHVHLNEPGRADWEGFATGTRAAAAGGVTTLVDMPLNSIPATVDVPSLEAKRAAALGRLHVDVAFWGGVVPGNSRHLAPLAAAGVAGFKAFMVPSGVDEFPHVGEPHLREALPILAELRLPLLVHAEAPDVVEREAAALERGDVRQYATWLDSRPPAAEIEAIRLLISLCREFKARVHVVHLSAAEAIRLLRAAREDGLPLSVETCPHYLTFAAEEIPAGATVFKCAPPIRDRVNRDRLWQGITEGNIDLVASDHSPCPPAMKRLAGGDFVRAWGGIGSLELLLSATWTGASRHGLSLTDLCRLVCEGPARLAGLRQKGRLDPGCDADLIIWDPDAEFVVAAGALEQRHKLTPYDGRRLRGVVHRTYLRGRVVHRRGQPAGSTDAPGRFVEPVPYE